MSLYGMIAGSDPNRKRLNEILALDKYDTGRERDIYVSKLIDHDYVPDGTYIVLLTRNGGGNRRSEQDSFDSLRTHPYYVDNWDCDWDSTYAEICFSIPKAHCAEVLGMLENNK